VTLDIIILQTQGKYDKEYQRYQIGQTQHFTL